MTKELGASLDRTIIAAMIRALALVPALLLAAPAQAQLTLCNRTSYVTDAAIGIERAATASTRGWFRVDPGACRKVIEEPLGADLVYVHARTPALYGTPPQPKAGHAEFCVGDKDFALANARGCAAPVAFTAIKPTEIDGSPRAVLAEEAEYDDAQARLAGIQRLLVIAGYDANPIDGVSGAKTTAALAAFLRDRRLPADASGKADFFDVLLAAASNPEGAGFVWCNDTAMTVMAAIGTGDANTTVTRGWYRVAPGRCVKPDLRGNERKVWSYGEAVDAEGRPVKRGDATLAWGGEVSLCVRDGKFEINDHADCRMRGLLPAGFAAVELAGKPSVTVRFKE